MRGARLVLGLDFAWAGLVLRTYTDVHIDDPKKKRTFLAHVDVWKKVKLRTLFE